EGVIEEATSAVARRLGALKPRVAIVLGSGLGGIAAAVRDAVRVPYREIPGFPEPGAPGHKGELVAGTLEGVPLVVQSGRFHLYEGHAAEVAALPTRVFAAGGGDADRDQRGGRDPPHVPAAHPDADRPPHQPDVPKSPGGAGDGLPRVLERHEHRGWTVGTDAVARRGARGRRAGGGPARAAHQGSGEGALTGAYTVTSDPGVKIADTGLASLRNRQSAP